jgi:hypothetical protein
MVRMSAFALNSKPLLQKCVSLLLVGLLIGGAPAGGEGPVEMRSSDITLAATGLLQGVVVDSSARPVSGITLHILHGDAVIASATSDELGEFSIHGLRHGAHAIQVGETLHPVRFWGTDSAPPVSTSKLAIVVDEPTVRGQMTFPGTNLVNTVSANAVPLVIISGAVAIVLASTLDNDGTPAPTSP